MQPHRRRVRRLRAEPFASLARVRFLQFRPELRDREKLRQALLPSDAPEQSPPRSAEATLATNKPLRGPGGGIARPQIAGRSAQCPVSPTLPSGYGERDYRARLR